MAAMKNHSANPWFHILYWLFVTLILAAVFGSSWENRMAAFYYICMLLPVVMATSYFFNYFLVPRYLLSRKYFRFILFFLYTLVVSLYLEIIVLTFAFVFLVKFHFWKMGPNSSDTVLLAVVLYLIVFLGSFLLMNVQLAENRKRLTTLLAEKERQSLKHLELISNRKTVRIPCPDILYIESLADYIRVRTVKGGEFNSKEKISSVVERLPGDFLRIHRSFIINTHKIVRYSYREIELKGITLPVGRSYQVEVRKKLAENRV